MDCGGFPQDGVGVTSRTQTENKIRYFTHTPTLQGVSMSRPLRQQLAAEFLGSAILIMAAVAPMIFFTYVLESSKGVALLANAIAVAFVLCVLIEMFAPISGAHFNPVVTLIMLIDIKIKGRVAALFVLVQIIGGIVGIGLVHLMFHSEVGAVVAVSENMRGYAILGEAVGTFILLLAILVLNINKSMHIPLMIGFLVGGQIMATSSTMFANPQVTIARMLSPTAVGIRPIDALLFIAMQIAGAVLAYVVYRLVFSKQTKESGT